MIDFKCTHANENEIYFCNDYSEILKRYPLDVFEKWVMATEDIPEYEDFQPMDIHSKWFGKYEEWCLSLFIDKNFEQLTEDFYNFKNK